MNQVIKIIFLATIAIIAALSIAFIFPAYHRYETMRKRELESQKQLNEIKKECIILRGKLYALGNNPSAIEKIAREKFNYCKPGETVYRFE